VNGKKIEADCSHDLLTHEQSEQLAADIYRANKSYEHLVANEITLAEYDEIQSKARKARDTLVSQNRRLVASIAMQYNPRPPMTHDDLLSEGMLALMAAIQRFEPNKGKFTTHAGYYIHQAIITYLNTQTTMVTVPVYLAEESSEVNKAKQKLFVKFGREPTIKEIASFTDKSTKKVKTILAAMKCRFGFTSSLDAVNEEDQSFSVEDTKTASPEKALEAQTQKAWILKKMGCLPERSQQVIKLYYGIDEGRKRTLAEVGQILGLTRERIRQILFDAKTKIREAMEEEL
jgi:RNA polymerase sigma factor (sigma-70 family)